MKRYVRKLQEGFRPNYRSMEDFASFLEDTLIPDLFDMGWDNTAQDFEEFLYWIDWEGYTGKNPGLGKYKPNFKNVRLFINYLEKTLIPDLYEAGYEGTPHDFEEAVYWLRKGGIR